MRLVTVMLAVCLMLTAWWIIDRRAPLAMTWKFDHWSDDGADAWIHFSGYKARICHGTSIGGLLVGIGGEVEIRAYVEVPLLAVFNRAEGPIDAIIPIAIPRGLPDDVRVRSTFDMDFVCNPLHVFFPVEVDLDPLTLPMDTRPRIWP